MLPFGDEETKECWLWSGIAAEIPELRALNDKHLASVPVRTPRIDKEVSAERGVQENGYLKCWTDGACSDQALPDLRRSGSGVYFGIEHPNNQYFKTMGPTQSSVLGELQAVELAIFIAWSRLEILVVGVLYTKIDATA